MQHLQYLGNSKFRVSGNGSTTVLVVSWGMWLPWVLIVKGAWWKKPCKHRLLRLWKISSYLVWYALAMLWELFLCLLGQINTSCQYKLNNSCTLVVLRKSQNLNMQFTEPKPLDHKIHGCSVHQNYQLVQWGHIGSWTLGSFMTIFTCPSLCFRMKSFLSEQLPQCK